MRYSKHDIDTHNVNYGKREYPAINVKVRSFGRGVSEEDLNCPERVFNRAMEYAFETACQVFWEQAPEIVAGILGVMAKEVCRAGRSGGWLVVTGLPPIEEWDAVMLAKWRKTESTIRAMIKGLSEKERVKEDIIANEWNKPGAELYNFYERGNGEVVSIPDLKAGAIEQGYGPIIRR